MKRQIILKELLMVRNDRVKDFEPFNNLYQIWLVQKVIVRKEKCFYT